jgi:hypothetical protein
MEEARLVTLKVLGSRSEAEIVASKLRAYGIESAISADDAGGMITPLSSRFGVKLLVLSEQADEAKAILE